MRPTLPILVLAAFGAGLFYWSQGPAPSENPSTPAAATIAGGKLVYEAHCAACHGADGVGTSGGPPLVHKIYEPGHHADITFQRAVSFGVRQHHWRFGDMPPVDGVLEKQLTEVVSYIRSLQRKAGIN